MNNSNVKHNVNWRVGLNDGTSYREDVDFIDSNENNLSPWLRLMEELGISGKKITSLSLIASDGRTFNLPSSGNNPKFRAFDIVDKPIGYRVSRAYGQDKNISGETVGTPDWFTIGVAVYNGYELQMWVNELNTRSCWSLVVPI